jgi:hypothetical protein
MEMPNGDPTIFGLPCRFPATPSIRPEDRVQGFDQKGLFGVGQARKFFSLSFPERQGKGGGGAASQRCAAAILPPSTLVTSAVVLSATA